MALKSIDDGESLDWIEDMPEKPPFLIEANAQKNLIIIKSYGWWNDEILADFAKELDRAIKSMTCARGMHRCIVDSREYAIQSKEFSTKLGDILSDPRMKVDRMAIVIDQALLKMQIKREIPSPNHRIFSDYTEALNWISET